MQAVVPLLVVRCNSDEPLEGGEWWKLHKQQQSTPLPTGTDTTNPSCKKRGEKFGSLEEGRAHGKVFWREIRKRAAAWLTPRPWLGQKYGWITTSKADVVHNWNGRCGQSYWGEAQEVKLTGR